jgi:hypothetical protein
MASWRGSLGLAAVAVSLFGCAAARARPDVHEDGWLLVETPHIKLHTALDRDDAIERARQLEQYWQVLARMYALVAPGAPPPRGQFPVIHLDSCRDVRRFTGSSAFVFRASDWMSKPIAVTCEANQDSTLIHEMAHLFNHHHFSGLPTWVEEGLATYYSSLIVRDRHAVIGNSPRLYSCQPPALPSFDEIRRMNHEQFHDEAVEHCNYYAAWKLVHMLNGTGTDRNQRFRRYLASLARSGTSEEAWAQAFGDLPAERLEKDYRDYHWRVRLSGWRALLSASEPTLPRVRPLRPGEAHILWINLLVASGRDAEIAAQLERWASVEPDSPEHLYWRAVTLRGSDALGLLRKYVSRRPDDERGWRALVSLGLATVVPQEHLGVGGTAPAGLAAMEGDVKQLIERSSDVRSYNLLGWYFAMRREAIAGLRFATRAVKADPACGICWDTVALLFFHAGKIPEALRAQERAASRLGHRAGPGVLARLRHYRAAAASSR